MPTATKKKHLPGITINPNMPNYSKDPFFVKKAEKVRALLAKYPFPKDLNISKKAK